MFLHILVGLLAFPSPLTFPSLLLSGVIQADPMTGITAAGTAPDFHRIPLHRSASHKHPVARIRMQRYCKSSEKAKKEEIK